VAETFFSVAYRRKKKSQGISGDPGVDRDHWGRPESIVMVCKGTYGLGTWLWICRTISRSEFSSQVFFNQRAILSFSEFTRTFIRHSLFTVLVL